MMCFMLVMMNQMEETFLPRGLFLKFYMLHIIDQLFINILGTMLVDVMNDKEWVGLLKPMRCVCNPNLFLLYLTIHQSFIIKYIINHSLAHINSNQNV